METKQEPPNAAEVKAAVKYWSRINRCPWRANGNAFYTRALRYLKHGAMLLLTSSILAYIYTKIQRQFAFLSTSNNGGKVR